MGGKNSKTSNSTTGTSGSIYSVPSNEANNNDVQGETKTTIDFTTEEKEVGLKLLQKVNLLNAIKLVALGQSIQSNDSAMAALTLLVTQLGFVKVGAEAVHVDAKLPPELENFNVLKEEKNVATALQDKIFVQAQEAVQEKPNDAAALAALQAVVANAYKVYDSTIQARLQEVDLKITCRKVVIAGNEDFLGVYDNMWQMTVKADRDGCDMYQTALASLTVPDKSTNQTTSDSATLYQHAAQIFAKYQTFVNGIVKSVKDDIKVSLPSKLKKMGRIIEKTILKRKDDPGNANKVCDIDRGMVLCDDMSQIASVINYLQSQQEANIIVVTRVKDRFFKAPSAGGWRDCMINFYFKDDPNQHICELQLIHNQMMTARKGLPGHAVYNRVRNASELLMLIGAETPKDKKELQDWLIEYHCGKEWKIGQPKNGDKITRGPPNLWDVRLITDMSELFNIDELKDFNEDISAWDVSNVKSMEKMFLFATSFNQPIGNWNVQNVSNMEKMFCGATSFNQPIVNWNVENVSNMGGMFLKATSFNQPIVNWNVQNVSNMGSMFFKAKSFNQPIENWNVQNVSTMERMFSYATLFNQPIVNWNVQNVSNMKSMFAGAKSFNQPIGNWNVQNVKTMANMFTSATSFNQPIGNWNVQTVSNMESMFKEATSFNQPIENWNVQNVSNMKRMFCNATSFNQPIVNWNVQNVSNMKEMFDSARSFKQTLPDEWAKKAKYTNP